MGIDDKLHDEIIETQKSRAKLWNWKITLIASIFAVGLGIGIESDYYFPLVLCCIPIVCAYTDLLSGNLSTRNRLIGKWRLSPKSTSIEYKNYEEFIKNLMIIKKVGMSEVYAVYGSSFLANFLVIFLSCLMYLVPEAHLISFGVFLTLGIAGICGWGATFIIMIITNKDHSFINNYIEETKL